MQWQVIVALVVAIPVILLPVLFIWFLNFGGIYTALKEFRARQAKVSKEAEDMVKQQVVATPSKRGQDE